MTYALFTGSIAALIAILAGGPFVVEMRRRGVNKAISADGPESHVAKAGTPTMGGLLIVGVALVVALIAAVPKDHAVLLPISVAAVLCAIGVYDDAGTLIDRQKREAHDRAGMVLKLIGFAAVGLIAAVLLYGPIDAPRLLVPHFGGYDIGPVYIAAAILATIAMTSAVGVTDGLDMLAASTTGVAFAAFGAIALVQHQTGVAAFCFALTGSLAGFLWWNAYPARIFMGDAGSLPLGGALAIVSLMTGWWLLLPVIGIVFVIDIASDVIQIGYFRLSGGKRVFRMAPVHHHFEKLGWHEVTVSIRFLVVGIVGALSGVGLALLH